MHLAIAATRNRFQSFCGRSRRSIRLASRARSGFLGGFLNLGGNIAGIFVPLIVGLIVQFTGSYFLALAFFAAAGIGLLLCSLSIDYTRKIQG